MAKCLRCRALGREKPNETEKKIDGVSVCKQCMLEDAANNRGRVMDYSGLKDAPAPAKKRKK